jgi:Fe-S-cluster containining protein
VIPQNGHGENATPNDKTCPRHGRSPTLASPGGRGGDASLRELHDNTNPCLDCGACCASFRVSFYWAEADAHPCGTVPQQLTAPVSLFLAAMKGTVQEPLRCAALEGEIGKSARCSIYPLRSSTCREFDVDDPRCNQARQRHGLPALPPALAR